MDLQLRLITVLDCLIFVLASNSTNLSRQKILRRILDESVYDSSIPPDFELKCPRIALVLENFMDALLKIHISKANVVPKDSPFKKLVRLEWNSSDKDSDDPLSKVVSDIPTMIEVQLSLLNIHSVSETSMEYSIDIYLRQQWEDPRLEYDNWTSLARLELDNKVMDKVWTPDTFFVNEKHAFVHNVTIPNKLMHIHRNGTVLYSMRVSLTLTCYMLLQKYPLDQQRCPIIIESYAYSVGNIQYFWKTEGPVEISDSVEMPNFEPERHVSVSDCTRNYTSRFSCLQAEIVLQRKVGYYIVQIFIPSILIVVLSWVGFWVDYDAVPARVSLGIMTVLTMTTQSSGAKQNLPHVSYIKAIDVWMATCLMFVFASLLEYAYVNVMARRPNPIAVLMNNSSVTSNGILSDDPEKQKQQIPSRMEAARLKLAARRIDKMSRIIFPVLFSIFNLVFWLYYILSPDP